jgi:hypothetical protein
MGTGFAFFEGLPLPRFSFSISLVVRVNFAIQTRFFRLFSRAAISFLASASQENSLEVDTLIKACTPFFSLFSFFVASFFVSLLRKTKRRQTDPYTDSRNSCTSYSASLIVLGSR